MKVTKEKVTAARVTAKLVGGPYSIELGVAGNWVKGPNGLFRNAVGNPILFAPVDAEKIVRLYNMDAHLT